MSSKRTSGVRILSALAVGAVGFAFGVLVAPQEGQRTRRRIAYQLERLLIRAEMLISRLTDPGVYSDAQRNRDALVADAQARADNIRSDIEMLLKELREKGAASQSSSAQ